MSENPFENAGNEFRDQNLRDGAKHDQSIEQLKRLAVFAEDGVKRFYGTAQSDVYINRVSATQFQVCFGMRPSKHRGILNGPFAQVVIFPDGRIMWAHLTEWHPINSNDNTPFMADALDSSDFEASMTPKLIEFLTESERSYQRDTV